MLLDLAFAQGESAGGQTAQLMKLLDEYGPAALRRAIVEALERNTPRASSVAFLLRRQPAPHRLALDLSRHPRSAIASMFARTIWRPTMNSPTLKTTTTTMTNNSLPPSSSRSVCAPYPRSWMTLSRAPPSPAGPRHQILEQLVQAEATERSRRSLERRLRISGIKRFKPMADFDWSWPTKIERDIIERALTLDFLGETRNLILVGRNGLGKTMIAQNICSRRRAGRSLRAVSFRRGVAGRVAPPDSGRPPLASCAPTPMWDFFASMKSAICPSMTRPPTYSMKSSTGVMNASQ